MSQFVFSPYLFFILLFPSVFVVSFKNCFLFLVDFLLIYVLSSQLSQFISYLNENSVQFVFFMLKSSAL